MIASVIQDIRYALRQLRKSPGFALTAVTVLALGLGANSAVFTLIDGILLRPLPYAQPDRIVAANTPMTMEGQNGFRTLLRYADVKQLADAAGRNVQTGIVLDEGVASVVAGGAANGTRRQVRTVEVAAGLLEMLGVQPAMGRVFRPEENEPGRGQAVVLSDDLWRELYNRDPHVLGKTMTMRGTVYTVVGVMPRGFAFPFGEEDAGAQLWFPGALDAVARTSMNGDTPVWAQMYARLPEGMTAEQLAANLTRAQELIAKESSEDLPRKIEVTKYRMLLEADARKPLGLLYAVVLGIWALACLNVTSLMLVRAVARSREMAVRSALGASRSRLLQQSIVESLLLSVAGSAVGLLAGQLALKLMWRQIERRLPLTSAMHVEWRVIAGMIVLALVTTVLTGLVPALRASRRDVQSDLHGVNSTASASHARTRETLVVAQLALTLVFLVGAGLFLRTIHALRAVPLGFTQQNVLTGGVSFNQDEQGMWKAAHADGTQINVVQTTYLPFLERAKAIPGVQVAALSSVLPMRSEFAVFLSPELDHKKAAKGQEVRAQGRLASAGLVDAMGIPMLKGRFFNESDSAGAPVAVVINQAFASKYFPGADPIGHTVSMGKGRFADAHIVGVIGNVKQGDVTQGTQPEMYFCLAQIEPGTPLYGIATAFIQVAIRARVPADTLRAQFDKALHEVAPDATTTNVETIHEAVEDSFGSQTLISHLLESFAGLALLIASVGLYGLLSFAVAQRTREIAVRLALGAQKGNILGIVLRRALLLVCAGLLCGSAMAWFAVSLARSYIYGVEAHDALTFIAVTVVLAAASFLAAWMPARYAASIEPVAALRSE
jgi:predicted permease